MKEHKGFLKQKKKWLYSASILAVLAGGVVGAEMIQENNPAITAQAVTLPNGATQVGTINNAPVVQSPITDMSSKGFQDIISSLLGETDYPPYIINEAYWGASTQLANGRPLSEIGEAPTLIFGRDGFLPSDSGIELAMGQTAYIQNVGSAIQTADGKTIPISLAITVNSATQPDGTPLDTVVMGAKSQSSVITLAWGSMLRNGENSGGQTEGGGIGGDNSDGTLLTYIDSISYTLTFINSETGQPLTNNTLMPIKNSDIDANQLATMDGNGALGYIIGPNSALTQVGNGFRSTSSGALNDDSVNLTENSYVVIKKYNSNVVQYDYQDNANDHIDIVTAHFGRVPFKINELMGGYLSIDKSTLQYGKDNWNQLYSFDTLAFDVVNKDGKIVDTIRLDKKGNGKSSYLPVGDYTLKEHSSNWSLSGQTVHADMKVHVEAGKTTPVKVENKAVTGSLTIKKTGLESGLDMWNQHYTLAGNEFSVTSLTDKKVYKVVTNDKGIATLDKLPLGEYEIREVKASNGFVNGFAPKKVKFTYKDQHTEVIFGETAGTNPEIKGENLLEKEDVKTGKEAQGKADMKNAEYQLFYNEDFSGKTPHKKGEPVKWSDIPKAKLLSGEKVTTSVINGNKVDHGDNVVINVDDEKLNVAVGNLALGKYVWREINAPEGYVLDKTEHAFELTKKDDKTQNIVAPSSVSKEQAIEAEIIIQKLVETKGETSESGFNGVEFTFTPLKGTKGEPFTVKTGVDPEKDEDGYARAKLVYGDYVMKETKGVEGYENIKDIYIHMETDEEKDLLTISASNHEDFSKPFSKRTFSLSDNAATENPNGEEAVGAVSTDKPLIRLSKLTFTDKDTPEPPVTPQPPKKDVTKTEGGDSINHGDVALSSEFVYALKSSRLSNDRVKDQEEWTILDNYDERFDRYNGRFDVVAMTDFGSYKKGDVLDKNFFTAEDKDGKVNFVATKAFLDFVNANKEDAIQFEIQASFFRHASADIVYNTFDETINGETVKSNEVDTKTPKPVPHKFDVVGTNVDLTGDKLLDDDEEMTDRYKDTKADPYNDKTKNNEAFNFNTKAVKAGDTIHYQLWLDTTPFDETSELTTLQMVDDYDEKTVEPNLKEVKVYNAKGEDVTKYFKVEVKDGRLTVRANIFTKATDSKGKEVAVVDTKKLPFGQVYKIEFPVTVKQDVKDKTDIVNVANQVSIDSENTTLDLPTETRVNPVDSNAPEQPQAPQTPSQPKQTGIRGILPSTGEEAGTWLVGFGVIVLGGAYALYQVKRNKQSERK
ncbi:LPXTG cell wall anchor domain-containing protein (plasmid) [Enterococcus faecalis]|uniref:LPXTG cell wall anchor domain-containing protein n=1 Tax=Enterococcus faecalis TaxID=1351 RepID=UPI0029C8DB23|nr:LPXTG cell wall anchor domain-containing protein [Enterococcus faecalis]WPH48354.1 LPXTG cell wall anchor domain-containing protein [Enterococcus faecalis]